MTFQFKYSDIDFSFSRQNSQRTRCHSSCAYLVFTGISFNSLPFKAQCSNERIFDEIQKFILFLLIPYAELEQMRAVDPQSGLNGFRKYNISAHVLTK